MSSDAIIFIPGIKGTMLVDTNRADHDIIWSGAQSNFESIEDLMLTNRHVDGAYFDEKRSAIIRPGEVESLAYGEFVRDISRDFEINKPIYIFHYDWRQSAVDSGRLLAEFIEYLVAKSEASFGPTFKKFDFVTHSLGNFVLRSFMKEYEIDVINKVVFACPPFRGSLEIVKAALVGQGLFGWVKTKTRKIIRSMPGALELLPTYKGCARFSGSHGEVDFFDQSHWQSNVTSSRGGQDSARLAKKFKAALKVAWETVDTGLLDLADLPEKVRDRMLVIARHGSDTMQEVDVTKSRSASGVRNLVDLEHARLTEHGDGTVPHVSSCCYWDCIQTLVLTDNWYDYIGRALSYPLNDRHAFVLNDERVQRLISRFLSNETFNHRSPGDQAKVVKGLIPAPVNEDGDPMGFKVVWE